MHPTQNLKQRSGIAQDLYKPIGNLTQSTWDGQLYNSTAITTLVLLPKTEKKLTQTITTLQSKPLS